MINQENMEKLRTTIAILSNMILDESNSNVVDSLGLIREWLVELERRRSDELNSMRIQSNWIKQQSSKL